MISFDVGRFLALIIKTVQNNIDHLSVHFDNENSLF